MTEPLAISVREAADLAGVSPRLIYERAADGSLPARKIGRRVLIPRAAFLRWLAGDTDPEPRVQSVAVH